MTSFSLLLRLGIVVVIAIVILAIAHFSIREKM